MLGGLHAYERGWKMKDKVSFIEEFLDDLPRGVRSRRIKDQNIPQAHWEPPERIIESAVLAYDPRRTNGKVLFGALADKLIGLADDRHILTIAGSRAGKSVTVIGNPFFYDGPVLCTDPKAELANRTALFRADLGQKVFILDPFGRCNETVAKFRARYNPLAALDPESDPVLASAIEGAARDFYEKSDNELASVLSTVRRHTKFLDYKAMRGVLSGHDFDLADLKRDPDGITSSVRTSSSPHRSSASARMPSASRTAARSAASSAHGAKGMPRYLLRYSS